MKPWEKSDQVKTVPKSVPDEERGKKMRIKRNV